MEKDWNKHTDSKTLEHKYKHDSKHTQHKTDLYPWVLAKWGLFIYLYTVQKFGVM